MKRYAVVLAVFGLAGCASSNVRGNFMCGAPEGTCAPTMNIDDGALHKIMTDGGQKEGASDPAQPSLDNRPDGPGRRAKLVFPAYTDAKGRFHEPMIVYANLNDNLPVGDAVAGARDDVLPGGVARRDIVSAAGADDSQAVIDNPPQSLATKPGEQGQDFMKRLLGLKPSAPALSAPPVAPAKLAPAVSGQTGTAPAAAPRVNSAPLIPSVPLSPDASGSTNAPEVFPVLSSGS